MANEKVKSFCPYCHKVTEKEKVGMEGVWAVYRCIICKNVVLLPP